MDEIRTLDVIVKFKEGNRERIGILKDNRVMVLDIKAYNANEEQLELSNIYDLFEYTNDVYEYYYYEIVQLLARTEKPIAETFKELKIKEDNK